jgi:hypothetical protein
LLAIGERLRNAQEQLLAGGDGSDLKRASAEERELVDELTRDGTALAAEAGTGATEALQERIRATLHAAALEEEIAAELAAGSLVREHQAAGMFGIDAAEAVPPVKARPAKKQPDRRELSEARAEQKKAERELASATKTAERAANRLESLQRLADDAAKKADQARARLREARQQEKQAARAHDRAARAVDAAEKRLS